MKLQSVSEYAREKQLSVKTVYSWIKKGKLETKKQFGLTLIVTDKVA